MVSAEKPDGMTLLELSEAVVENRAQIEDVRSLLEEVRGQLVTMRELLAPSEAALQARTEYLNRHQSQRFERWDRRIEDCARALGEQRRQVLDLAEQIPARMSGIERQVLKRLGKWSAATLVMIGAAGLLCVIAASRAPSAATPTRPAGLSEGDPANMLFDLMNAPEQQPASKRDARRPSKPRPSGGAPGSGPNERR